VVWKLDLYGRGKPHLWCLYSRTPVLDIGGDLRVGHPSVIKDRNSYSMWYQVWTNSVDRAIGYATSPDGTTWTKSGAPVLDWTAPFSWEDSTGMAGPNVIKDGGTYKMWYAGSTKYLEWRIGYATSPAVEPVPEPSTMLLFASGILGLVGFRKFGKR
jgi:hypothetical protein